ncbi:MAG: ArsA family ATPase, partial [Bacteroidota bacterium]
MRTPASDQLSRLYDENLRLLLFGGKGGVGKTTVAAAFSLYLSDHYPQKHFLVISTDPAHSLSDSFDYPLASAPKPVYGRANLSGMEIDSEKLFARFQIENSQRLKNILSRGTYLDEQDISRLLELSFPGLDELMALIEIMELLNSTEYDLLILDTAPTGHTLRLLDLPILMQEWVKFLDLLMAKHRYMSRVYTRTYKLDDADDFINVLAGDLQKIRKLLQNKSRCRFVPIATPEPVVLS